MKKFPFSATDLVNDFDNCDVDQIKYNAIALETLCREVLEAVEIGSVTTPCSNEQIQNITSFLMLNEHVTAYFWKWFKNLSNVSEQITSLVTDLTKDNTALQDHICNSTELNFYTGNITLPYETVPSNCELNFSSPEAAVLWLRGFINKKFGYNDIGEVGITKYSPSSYPTEHPNYEGNYKKFNGYKSVRELRWFACCSHCSALVTICGLPSIMFATFGHCQTGNNNKINALVSYSENSMVVHKGNRAQFAQRV